LFVTQQLKIKIVTIKFSSVYSDSSFFLITTSILYLKSTNSCALEAKIGLEVLSNFTNKTLEGQFADQQLSGLLVTPDLTKGDSSGPDE